MKNAKTVKANANEDEEQEKSLAYLENLQASMTTAQFNNLEWNEHSKTNNVGLELVSDFAKAKTKQLKLFPNSSVICETSVWSYEKYFCVFVSI